MKKVIIIMMAIATFAVVSESKAQFSAGLRIGFNASKYTGDVAPDVKFAPGLHIGPYFRVAFKEKYRVQADVLFSTKGGVSNDTTNGKTYDIPFYIDVPVMFNYKPIAGLYIEAGVQPSFALTTLGFGEQADAEFASAKNRNIKTVDFAPVVGLGYEFKKVSLGLRGAFGVTNLNKITSYDTDGDGDDDATYPSAKNMTLMATFGFKF
jgi:hypothetical protein